MAKKHIEKFSASLAIKEMKIKTILRLHLIPVKIVLSSRTQTTHVGKDVREKKLSHTVGGNVN
jgi:hypothetical protein